MSQSRARVFLTIETYNHEFELCHICKKDYKNFAKCFDCRRDFENYLKNFTTQYTLRDSVLGDFEHYGRAKRFCEEIADKYAGSMEDYSGSSVNPRHVVQQTGGIALTQNYIDDIKSKYHALKTLGLITE